MKTDTVAVLAILAGTVAWSVFQSRALMSFNGRALVVMGALFMLLSFALGRWAGGTA